MKYRRKLVGAVEITLSGMAVLFLGVYAGAALHRWISGSSAVRQFDVAKANAGSRDGRQSWRASWPNRVDFSLWSKKRVLAYTESLSRPVDAPMAILSVPKFGIRVAVLEGTDEFALNRGVGWIAGTARPGERGNIGIAGHRDGFFRALKDIETGDRIGLETMADSVEYQVEAIEIVTPEDVNVLRARQKDSVTLVTCFPFYFVGDAPQRFIVHAVRRQDGDASPNNR